MRNIIRAEKAPAAIGPYSQAVKVTAGTLIFCSGQIPLDPKSGEIVGRTAGEQCQQAMENLTQVLAAAGATLNDIVKTTVYLTDIRDFDSVNEMYATYFTTNPPARAAIEVSRLPKSVKVEIEAIAAL
jgi:2-iminobutanoate/2-iminopropanoate deaminase